MEDTARIGDRIVARVRELRQRNAAGVRVLRRVISQELADTDREAVIEIATRLARIGAHHIAYELVMFHPAATGEITAAEVERLGKGIESWGAVDCFCYYISGPAWRSGRVKDVQIHKWARSEDKWWRRAALVSTVPLNVRAQGGKGDAKRTLGVCELLVADQSDTVVKAMSWALRALAVREPSAVERFIEKHDAVLSALVKREVRNKLRTGVKTSRRVSDFAMRIGPGRARV